MANTIVSFTTDEDEILANFNWLPLSVGDTIGFADPTAGTAPVLFFSPNLQAVLTPTPPACLTLGQAPPSVFTVTAAQPGAYTILIGASSEFPPFFPERSSINLFFESMPTMVGGAPSPVDPPPRSGN